MWQYDKYQYELLSILMTPLYPVIMPDSKQHQIVPEIRCFTLGVSSFLSISQASNTNQIKVATEYIVKNLEFLELRDFSLSA